jgi:hypothetical protein
MHRLGIRALKLMTGGAFIAASASACKRLLTLFFCALQSFDDFLNIAIPPLAKP